ncbi:MAG: GIY-YIG nuclease family protein, partial [Phormidesmis sp.]
FVYLIRTRQNALYTGITTNIVQRLSEHEQGKGAKYLRAKGPLRLVYAVELGNRSLATKAEYRIKRLAKSQKEAIIAQKLDQQALLIYLSLQDSA